MIAMRIFCLDGGTPALTDEVFDEEYARLWSVPGHEVPAAEIDALAAFLPMAPARVLDVACGAGRYAIALARRGYELTGIDIATPFLERARRRAIDAAVTIDFRQGDMRHLALAGFAAAVVLGNSFGYHSDDENLMSLEGIATAVVAGGTVVIELLNRDRIVANFRPHSEHVAGDGTILDLESAFDAVSGVKTVTHRWIDGDGQRRERRTEQRLYTPPELAAMCAAVGLIPVAWRDGLTGGPFHFASRRMVLVAYRG
jgi:SAM-dependent methyltransferase